MNKTEEDFRCHVAELVQLLTASGYSCWKASDGISVHFAGGKITDEIKEQARKMHIIWWPNDWEKRIGVHLNEKSN